MVTTFFRASSKFEIRKKSKNGRRLSPEAARGLGQDKGLPDDGSATDCLSRLSASSTVRAKKRKHHPGAAFPDPTMSLEDARGKLIAVQEPCIAAVQSAHGHRLAHGSKVSCGPVADRGCAPRVSEQAEGGGSWNVATV